MSLVTKMQKIAPEKGPVFTAIRYLKTEEEITQFRKDYVQYIIDEGYDEKTANKNIGYILGYFSQETCDLWYNTLKLSHPVFGGTPL